MQQNRLFPMRDRDDINSYLRPSSILGLPYPQVLTQSYEFASAAFLKGWDYPVYNIVNIVNIVNSYYG